MKQLIPIFTLLVGLAIGWFSAGLGQSGGENELDSGKGDNDRTISVPKSEYDALVEKNRKQVTTLKKELAVARDGENAATAENSKLRGEIDDLRKIKEEWDLAKEEVEKARAKRMAAIEKRFKSLSSMGIQALVANNEIGKLVADLLQEGERGHQAVMALLQSSDDDEKMLGVVLMLQGMASEKSIDPLKDLALTGGDETMRAMASQALLRMNDEAAVKAMETIVAETKDEGVKVNSLYGLARNGHEQGVQQLVDYYNDPNSAHADVLTQSLLILRNPEAQPLIDAVVNKYKDRDEDVKNRVGEAAVAYYKHVNNQGSRQALQNIVDDPSASAKLRQMAQDALNAK